MIRDKFIAVTAIVCVCFATSSLNAATIPAPMDLNFWPGAVAMILFATLTASLVTTSGRSAWFVGVLAIMVYLMFAAALYLLPPSGTT